jgi:hypothetical protein
MTIDEDDATKDTSEAVAAQAEPPPSNGKPKPAETSWGYPAFARAFPRTPDLDALVASFAAGDYRAVREGAPKLAASTKDEDVKRAAELLRARIEPDPLARVLFLFAGGLLVVLTTWWVMHNGPEEGRITPPAKPASSAVRATP